MIKVPNLDLPDIQIQPAGVDLTMGKIFEFTTKGQIDYDNSNRKISDVKELKFEDEIFLKTGVYKVQLSEIIKIPNDCLGICLPRSTLLRCGATIHTAFWDPGYEGKSEILLVVHNPNGLILKKKARIAQMTFAKVEDAKGSYKGAYHKENL